MHVRYTSISGGTALHKAANDSVKGYLKTVSESDVDKGGFTALFDLKNDFPSEWYQVNSGETFPLSGIRDHLTFWTRAAVVSAKASYFITGMPVDGKNPAAAALDENKVVFENPQGLGLRFCLLS